MAVLHRAYDFDAPRFLDDVRVEFGTGDTLDLTRLRERAGAIVSAPSATAAPVLADFRYDAEWFDPPPGEEVEPVQWLLILLADAVRRTHPGLSNRFATSYHVLKCALPVCGWTVDDVQHLFIGDSLNALLAADKGLAAIGASDLRTLGGWLPRAESRLMLTRLTDVGDAFHHPTPAMAAALDDYVKTVKRPAADLLAMAYDDAVDMLTEAAQRDIDLLLFLD